MQIQDAVMAAANGDDVVIVCRSRFDAESAAKKLYEKLGNGAVRSKTCVSYRGGTIEFAWLETSTGRRLDDYARADFQIVDAWQKDVLPA